MSVLQTIDLKKYYGIEPNINRALDGVNFSVVVLSVALDDDTGDRKFSADVLGLRKRTSGEFNQTIVMMTHNNELARLADRMVKIEDGKMWDLKNGLMSYLNYQFPFGIAVIYCVIVILSTLAVTGIALEHQNKMSMIEQLHK